MFTKQFYAGLGFTDDVHLLVEWSKWETVVWFINNEKVSFHI